MTWNKNMDDAPRDGTEILVLCKKKGGKKSGLIAHVSWEGESEWWDIPQGDILWPHKPTHWMPLPQPPEVEG